MSLRQKSRVIASESRQSMTRPVIAIDVSPALLAMTNTARPSISLDCRAALAMTGKANQFFRYAGPVCGPGVLSSYVIVRIVGLLTLHD